MSSFQFPVQNSDISTTSTVLLVLARGLEEVLCVDLSTDSVNLINLGAPERWLMTLLLNFSCIFCFKIAEQ